MADEDWYISQGRARMQQISAARASAVADLEMAKANYDDDSATTAIQTIADLDAQRANLSALYDQYVRSQYPPAPPVPTKEERLAKPWERMDYSDVWELSKSKYGPPDEAKFREGMAEVARRRSRGE